MRRALLIAILALPLSVGAQTPLTEAEALRLGLGRTALAELERGTLEVAEADRLGAGQRPNPTLGYTRDELRGASGTVQHTWTVAQTFDISGRRQLHKDAASRRLDAATATNAARRAELAAEIRRRFYDVLLKQEIVRAAESWTERFACVEGVVQKLTRAGEASGYGRRRLAREREAAEARLAVAMADLERARERLGASVGTSPSMAPSAPTCVRCPSVPRQLISKAAPPRATGFRMSR